MTKGFLRGLLLLAGLCLTTGAPLAFAQDTAAPQPDHQYLDTDRIATMPEFIGPGSHRKQRELDQLLKYDPQNVRARVQSGLAMVARGLRDRAYQEFNYAVQVAPPNSAALRHAHWGFGWGALRAGDYPKAVSEWQLAQQGYDGHASWVPWTMAIGLWAKGDRDLAIAYWESAVRSNANRWASTRGLDKEMADWQPEERNIATELHAEWKHRLSNRN
ncbi:MAG: hypothetical protein R3F01_06685 [Lysobacteraceae bacterium]